VATPVPRFGARIAWERDGYDRAGDDDGISSRGSSIETYWVDEYVDATLGKLTAFYDRTI
jgi:hypothetical protein